MDIEKYIKALNQIDIGKIASDMVKIPSYSFMENQEKEIARYIYNFFQKEDIESELIEILPGRYNVNATIKGVKKGKSLMLLGHMDTVPPYDMQNPFKGDIINDKLYGRGSVDMKGSLASMMATFLALKNSGLKLDGDLYFISVADEEEEGLGAKYLVENGPIADATIVGEPTNMKIDIGQKGLEWIEIEVNGKKAHGGDRINGINAIEMSSRFIHEIYEKYVPILNGRYYPILGEPTINIGTIQGGDQPSTCPGKCKIQLDRRCVPTESISQVYSEINDIVYRLNNEDPKFKATVKDMFQGKKLLPHKPYCINEMEPIVISIKKSMCYTTKKGEVGAFPAWSDAGTIASNTKSKCIVMGPGCLSVAHTVDEYISVKDMNEAALIYGKTAMSFCI